MGKKILAVLVGAVAATAVIFALESIGHRMYAPPGGLNMKDPAAVKAFVASIPAGAFALVLVAYALGSLVGGMVATLVAGRVAKSPALIVGGLLTAFGVMNLVSVPQPLWFGIASTVLYLPFAWLGSKLVMAPRNTP